ncbi:MAG: hypothetical protein HQ402_03590 [Parcubacteria group bacterium]|nr:hypothetical protein [Parcubacteria group bacterium]
MKNENYIVPVVLVCLFIILLGGYYFFTKGEPSSQTVQQTAPYILSVGDKVVSVTKDGAVIQTIPFSQDALDGVKFLPNKNALAIIDQDVNFDGNPDIAILTGVGYGGVNYFYDYYVYNPATGVFEADPVLTSVGNPELDVEGKQINGSYRSGPSWYIQAFEFDGKGYKNLGEVAEEIPKDTLVQ